MFSVNLPRLPIFSSFSNYGWQTFRSDFQAGTTVALLAIPQCMAYALLAEMNPVYGLYAAFIGVIAGSLFASSEIIITGPTAKVSLVVGSVLIAYNGLDPVHAVVVLTVMVGFLQLLFATLGLGNLASFVSDSVVRGFIVGGGIVIIGDQCIYLLDAAQGKSPYFILRLYEAATTLLATGQFPYQRLTVGVAALSCILLLRTLDDRLPAGILVILLGGVFSAGLGFEQRGIQIVGRIPRGLPDLTLPSLSLQHWSGLFSGALALTILGSVQTLSIAKSITGATRSDLDENQELFGQGMANLLCGFFQGYPVSASFTRSFLNHNIGAATRGAGLVCGGLMALIIFLAAPYAYFLPVPVLAALIIVVVADIFEWSEIKTVLTVTRLDSIAFSVTFISVLVLKLDTAIYVGVATTLLLYLRRSSRLDLKEYKIDGRGNLEHIREPAQRRDERIALIDVNGEVFFGAAESIRTRIHNLLEESDELQVIVLRLKNAMNLDSSSVRVLEEIARDLRNRGKTLLLSGVTPQIRESLQDSGVAREIDRDKILIAQKELLSSTKQALERAQDHIDDVLETDRERSNEDPDLTHTLQELMQGDDTGPQNPIRND